MKLLIPLIQVKKIRRQFTCYRGEGCLYNSSFLSKNKIYKEQLYSQILELRKTSVSRFKNITFDRSITKPISRLEWKVVVMFDKNPKIVLSLDSTHTHCIHPLFQEIYDFYLDGF